MDKGSIYDDFLKSLRVGFTNAATYSKDHPLFLKSIEALKIKTDAILTRTDPLEIGITPDSLVFHDQTLSEERLYEEVVDFFHSRKVKSVKFMTDVTNKELTDFLLSSSLSPKEIIAQGGLKNILEDLGITNIIATDLDYSQLLKDKGQEVKDVWAHLLNSSFEKKDFSRLAQLIESFKDIIKGLSIKELLDNEQILKAVDNILKYLESKDKAKFLGYSKELAKLILRSNFTPDDAVVDKLKILVRGLGANELSDILLKHLESNNRINPLGFNLLAKLFGKEDHQAAATLLGDKILKNEGIKSNSKFADRIKELVSLPNSSSVLEVYSKNLMSILQNISLGSGLAFDLKHLGDNYYLTLLELLYLERNLENIELILNIILKDFSKVVMANDLTYLKRLSEIIVKKKDQIPEHAFKQIDEKISIFAEKYLFSDLKQPDIKYLISLITQSKFGHSFYLDVIFKEQKISAGILQLFFKLFPDKLDIFCQSLFKKSFSINFIKTMLESLSGTESSLSTEVCKRIFYSSKGIIKYQALVMMKKLPIDKNFILSILKKGSFNERQEAVAIAIQRPELRESIAKELLSLSNPLGLNSRLISENLKIVNNNFFIESKSYLDNLSRYKFFWNRSIRNNSKQILKKHNESKN